MNPGRDGAAVQGTATLMVRMLQFGDSMFPIGGFSFSNRKILPRLESDFTKP